MPSSINKEGIALLLVGGVLLALSGIAPNDRATWLLETFPIFIAAPLLIVTGRRFPLTPLAYRLVFLHALVLMLGAHYNLCERAARSMVAGGFRPQPQPLRPARAFHAGLRAGYHRVRTFAVRTLPLRPGKWLFTLVAVVCLAISTCYEFIEWAAASILGQGADAFLGA